MADKPNESTEAAAPAADAAQSLPAEQKTADRALADKGEGEAPKDEAKTSEEPKPSGSTEKPAENATEKPEQDDDKAAADTDAEKKDTDEVPAADGDGVPVAGATETPTSKAKGGRRKSTAGEGKGKTLNRKASKARLTHLDAQPGDHFLIKLKGFPPWPGIVCDETMLPLALVNNRPVSAARPDGTYNEAYADGGKRAHDRTFPAMFLSTNEFTWAPNTNLSELTAEKAKESIPGKTRKDLKAAFELAAEHHSIDHYKDILKSFQEELIAQEEARKEAVATPKKSKKSKAKAADSDEDVEMVDADTAPKSSKSKKRKAEDDTSTPQRSDSVKKPKIKLNTSSTPKAANAGTPKTKDDSAVKGSKAKAKKGKDAGDKKGEVSKEPKMTPEERHARKEKEVLYLRHKLQRGLLTREQQPTDDEMQPLSDYIKLLENFADLEGSIIRATKINKVLKGILKLSSIPREEDFHFKDRSQALLDQWNKILATDGTVATNGASAPASGAEKKSEVNGVKESADEPKSAGSEKTPETNGEGNASKEKPAQAKSEASDGNEAKGEKSTSEGIAAAAPEPISAAAD